MLAEDVSAQNLFHISIISTDLLPEFWG